MAIHWICVALITWSVLAALWSVSLVAAYVGIGLALAFYARLSLPIAVGMLAVSALMIVPLPLLGDETQLAASIVFVLAWSGQFVCHAIEGRKPSFLDDAKVLLIGPAWLPHFVYRKAGIPY